jgi:epoxyqueuosine reductase
VLEREWGARAGLGWIGKNTSLLDRQFGSELFLGLLLTDLDLATDGPATDHCGRCTACIDACPTRAFVEPRILDARRCVGYLTIEHRSPISERLYEGVGSMVAGCDVCQEVCPWTARSPTNLHSEFQPAPHRFRPRLETLQGFDEAAFREWRSGSPLTRIPFSQFRRTLEVVKANLDPRPQGNADAGTDA